MATSHRVAVIVGSLRKQAFSLRVANALVKLAPPSLQLEVVTLQDISFFNQDLEGTPPADWVAFRDRIKASAAVLFVMPEYNRSVPGVLKNAIDWMAKPWNDKPIALIGYGWVGGARAITHLRTVLGSLIAAKALETEANLRFTKEIDLEGNVIDAPATEAAINTVLEELKTVLA